MLVILKSGIQLNFDSLHQPGLMFFTVIKIKMLIKV